MRCGRRRVTLTGGGVRESALGHGGSGVRGDVSGSAHSERAQRGAEGTQKDSGNGDGRLTAGCAREGRGGAALAAPQVGRVQRAFHFLRKAGASRQTVLLYKPCAWVKLGKVSVIEFSTYFQMCKHILKLPESDFIIRTIRHHTIRNSSGHDPCGICCANPKSKRKRISSYWVRPIQNWW